MEVRSHRAAKALTVEICPLAVAYARGKFEPVPRDRKDWYD
jgi:hypothetical protein